MSIEDEFATVNVLLDSDAETRGVDAFALSLIKAEKQARRLFTYLVYQHSWCNRGNVSALRDALAQSNRVYFNGLLAGWDALYPRSVDQLIGAEYKHLNSRLREATMHRNKIFHGQLTKQGLTRQQLFGFIEDIRTWCRIFGVAAQGEVGYDGCSRNSFRKAVNSSVLCVKYKVSFANIREYQHFIKKYME
jgi:hypothetical protein